MFTSLMGAVLAGASLAFTHITVIDATGAPPLDDQTVVIVGERITAVGSTSQVQIPAGAQVVDGRGKYLIPGLWDLHVHLEYATDDVLPVFVANGITGIRELHTAMPEIRRLREAGRTGALLVPQIVAAGNMIEDGDLTEFGMGDRLFVKNAEEARRAVDTLAKLGPDMIKLHHALRREVYFAVLDEATRLGLPVAGHYPVAGVTLREVADAGQRSVEHALFGAMPAEVAKLTPPARDALLAHVKERGVEFVPTLIISAARKRYPESFADALALARRDPRARYISAQLWQTWEELLSFEERVTKEGTVGHFDEQADVAFLGVLHRAGVTILPGTDFLEPFLFPGSSLHEELIELVKQVGLTPHEALQSATRQAAELVGLQDSYGTIQVGKIADVVLVRANPLTAIENTQQIEAVVRAGRLFDRAALDDVLKVAAGRIQQQKP
jgi:imidazolonepropionase-like amidohydrolase